MTSPRSTAGAGHLLVLAELPVGGHQVGEIDATEGLALADRLRIVHRGGDEVIEVDVLDVEGLAHVRAARAQELRDLGLILAAVELGLDRIGCGRDLAEGQSGRENLDEESFHRALRGARDVGSSKSL